MREAVTRLNAALEGRYHIDREVGEGGMATVYLADDLRHERKVALKVLKPELAAVVGGERFLAEIKTTANLQHPHILPLYDSGEADSFLFYAMPYVEGESLRDRLDREHQLPVDDAVQITKNVAEALAYAHERGVIHRDIKPANILLQSGKPVISDFGIALAVGAAGGGRLTETGLSLGTPHYMSPEQATGDAHVGPATDTYALGCVLYEMLIGEPPHMGSTPQAVLGRIITEPPRPLTEQRRTVPRHVDAAVAKALEKIPADRFRDAREFVRALSMGSFQHETSGSNGASGSRAGASGAGPLAGWAVAAVLAIVAGWGWIRPGAPDPARSAQAIALGAVRSTPDTTVTRNMAISPDGAIIVYSDTAGGTDQLWAKQRDRVDPEPIRGTTGGRSPFFSPDGEWVGFFDDVGLRKVPVTGGAPITLAQMPALEFRAGGWGEDGTIVFLHDGISVVHEDGGETEIVVPITGALGGGSRTLSMLPEDRGFLYGACATDCTSAAVWVRPSGAAEPHVLLESAARAWYVPDRGLVYASQEGGVFRRPIDLNSLSFTGPATPLFDGVRVSRRSLRTILPEIVVSASGSVLYASGSVDGLEHQVVWVDSDGVSAPVDSSWTVRAPGVSGIDLSPDGSRLAITVGRPDQGDVIAIKEIPNGAVRQIGLGASNYRPQWAPDGDAITYLSGDDSINVLYTYDVTGTSPPTVLAQVSGRTVEEGFWSPDREWLVLRLGGLPWDIDRDLVAVRPGSDEITPIEVIEGSQQRDASLSPDGRWLAYRSDESGQFEFYVRSFPGADGGKHQVSLAGGALARPRWSDDGRTLYYANNEGLVAAAVSTDAELEVLSRRVLFPLRGRFSTWFDVSADGRFVMVESKPTSGVTTSLVRVDNLFAGLDRR